MMNKQIIIFMNLHRNDDVVVFQKGQAVVRPPRVVAVKIQPRLPLVGLADAHHPHKFVAPALKSYAILGTVGGKVDGVVPCDAFQDVPVQSFACVNYHRMHNKKVLTKKFRGGAQT